MEKECVWVVTKFYPMDVLEPIVTVYDNKEAAIKHFNHVTNSPFSDRCCIDCCEVYSNFNITG